VPAGLAAERGAGPARGHTCRLGDRAIGV